MNFVQKIKNTLTSIVFYPLFIIPYFVFLLVSKVSYWVQYLFTVVYIERICGYKRNEKIIEAINSLPKLPQNVVITLSLSKYQLESELNSQQKIIQKKLIQDYIHVLSQINNLESIRFFIESQSELLTLFQQKIKEKIGEKNSKNKIIYVIDQSQCKQQYTEKLTLPENNNAPLMIVFSNYESTCHIPSKYLVNSELAFNQPIMASTKYDLYRSFCQYSHSKQRNGK